MTNATTYATPNAADATATVTVISKVNRKAEGSSSNPAGVVKRTNAYFVDPSQVTRREGWNPRFDFGEIDLLAKSLAANGMLNPIRVKRLAAPVDGKVFELIDGDRRLTACEHLLKKDPAAFPEGIPAVIVDKGQEDITSLIQMFEANAGKAFLPLEEAAAYQRMRDAGLTLKEICAAVSRKQVHVSEMLNLLKADDSVQEAAKSGAIGKTMAKKIATVAKGDKAKQKELVEQAKKVADPKARRALNKEVDKAHRATAAKKGKTLKIRALSDAELSDIGASMAETLVAKMQDHGLSIDTDLVAMIKKDPMLVIAYSAGALDALKVAAGGVNNLVI